MQITERGEKYDHKIKAMLPTSGQNNYERSTKPVRSDEVRIEVTHCHSDSRALGADFLKQGNGQKSAHSYDR